MHWFTGEIPVVQGDGSLAAGDQPDNHLETGGLAGAIRAQQADYLAADHFFCDINNNFPGLVALAEVLSNQFADTSFQYIVPDVFVFKRKGEWVVELNMDAAPRLRINSQYANMVRRGDNSQDNNYMKNHLQEARWFLKSLQSRHETLLKVANSIVARQRGFLDYGEEAMKPLVLRSIADEVNMHESTVSRVTTSKYMHTPRGIYEFKYFFSSHVGTEDGGECSATAIRALIKKLVAAENPQKPLSDNKITGILSEQGIKVARRTIAKYREAMSILPSNERKRMA